jgi:hypothetical protein
VRGERVDRPGCGRVGEPSSYDDTGQLAADGQVVGSWFVVPGSATGELAGLRGEGGFTAQLGQHAEARIEYWFD